MITMSSAMHVLPAPRWRPLIIGALVALAGLLSGCSAIRLVYGQGPDIVYWWLNDSIDIDREQKPAVRDALDQWFAWHRRTQLPDYALLLARAEKEALVDTTPARVCEWQAELTTRAETAFERIVPAAAALMPTVTPAQIRHLEQHNEKANEKYRGDYLQRDAGKRARALLERSVDRAETLYGRLDRAQREAIAALLATSPFDPELWLAERRQRQRELVQMLRDAGGDGSTRAQDEGALRLYARQLTHSPREAYARYWNKLTAFNCAFAATLHNGTTPDQRRHAQRTLAGWEGDMRALVSGARPVVDAAR